VVAVSLVVRVAALAVAAFVGVTATAHADGDGSATAAGSGSGGGSAAAAGSDAIVLPAAPIKKADDDGEPKLSLPTESDRVAWTAAGFRLALAFVAGDLHGERGAPSAGLVGVGMHAGLRLDRDWSLVATFKYARAAAGTGGVTGLWFQGTIDPTWHITRSLAVALGFGFGGIASGRTGGAEIAPFPSSLDSSYTFPSSATPMPRCSGVGAAVVARATYSWVVGPRSSAYLDLDAFGQYTECIDPTGNVDPDTAQPIVRIQYWPQDGFTFNLGFAWR
jgi:hypothetical protein